MTAAKVDRMTVSGMTALQVHEKLMRALENDRLTADASHDLDYAQDLMEALDEELTSYRATRDWIDADGQTFGDLKKAKVIKPGVLLELDDGSHCLVGDINTLGGGCDDCPDVRRSDPIRRYRTVWEP